MNKLTTVLRWIFVAVFAVAALPASAAPEKKFSVAMSPNVVSVGSVGLTATITNQTPNGNSSINSLKVTLPTGYTVDGSTPPTANWPGQVTYTSGVISISNMSPLKPNDSFVLTMQVIVSGSAPTCSSQTWNAQAWTGSSFSGDTFRQLFPPEFQVNSTTSVVANLPLAFTQQPSNGAKGVAIAPAVAVSVQNSCGAANATVTITADNGCTAPGCLSGNSVASSGGAATFPALKINTPGKYKLTASAPGFTSVVSQTFTVFDGILNCEPAVPFTFSASPPGVTNINQPGFAEGQRGKYNKDGTGCTPIGYTFASDILNSNSGTLSWDTTSQPGATFKYTVTWKPEYVNSLTGLPERTTYVAWFDTAGNPIPKVKARACLSDKLPTPYGTVATGGLGAGVPSLTVSGLTAVPPPPFPITIDLERLTVTGVAGNVFTVTRGVGGTADAPHAAGKSVMSNPLPLDAALNQMRMCIVEEGWTAYPATSPATADCAPADSTKACVLPSTTIMDLGDGFFNRDI